MPKALEEDFDLDEDVMDRDDEDTEDGDDEVAVRRSKKKKKKTDWKALTATALDAAEKLKDIGHEMMDKVFEREEVVKDIMLALIAKENILLIGPPGTAKTLLAELLVSCIEDAKIFKWMMNRTTDPSDLAGPYSISAMEQDRFMRVTTGRLPEAHVGFIDEIFKSNEPALNFLLPLLNEGVYYNDGKQMKAARRIIIAASNELPDTEDLSAFFDRFIFRHWVDYVQDPQNRVLMGRMSRDFNNPRVKGTKMQNSITLAEIDAMQKVVHTIDFPATVEATYDKLYRDLQNNHSIHISDRRYAKGQVAMQAHALLNGRTKVTNDDFAALTYILGNTKGDIDVVAKEVGKYKNPYENKIKEFVAKAKEVHDAVFALSSNRVAMAGEAVTANANLTVILNNMEDEIKEARANGVDTKPLEKMMKDVENMMEKISDECLKTAQRSQRKW